MKRIVLSLLAVCIIGAAYAQKSPLKRGKSFGISFFLQDFRSGLALDSGDKFKDINDRGEWYRPTRLSPGFALSYAQGLTPKIDLRGTLSASFEDYLFKKRAQIGINDFLGELDVSVNAKALNDNHVVIPYLSAGIGASFYKGFLGAIAPVGLGLQFNLFNDAKIDLQSQMRLGLTDNTTHHLYHSIGIIANVGSKKKVETKLVTPPVANKDADNDGVLDDVDDCPTEAGKANLKGCPDKDNDGIADKDDNCPTQPGTAKYKGCPVPDSDGDGINDENDKCINQPGVAKYQGCPIPDGDGDGVNDEEDKCPTVAGVAEQQGCPAIKEGAQKSIDYAAKNILFETGKSTLKTASYKGLNDVVKVLNENPDVKINIDGHTDNTGDVDKNMALSQSRADAVKVYFIKKGIAEDRITSTGHGQDEPVADNATTVGKAKNRRVELKLGY